MRAKIEIAIDDAKTGRLAMLELAELMTKLTAQIMRAGAVTPITITNAAGDTVASLTIEHDDDAAAGT
jgi:hypothetical protein